ncbi:ABC transporter ATP-binding protein [Mesoterricola silvestris]|uniref:Lipoprotein-releasing system ATP-binding protein LolD n=1 Tax=Mesoterricola silvestris TaxID=2927979 RepID=A0AA48K9U9_9BACT|nr:ABC transporter ATP-binding protein [Mesoterricola silvestris]BDU74359.1 lipoprotein-releasing system ATP-binding protein LolD [Mesoterricola silvestris]
MTGLALSIKDLHKTYTGAEHPVFDGFSMAVEPGELCAIVGVSGVGKTTLLNCVAGLDRWEGGTIEVGGDPVPMGRPEASALFRREHVGLAFQQPHLLPEFTVEENLLMPIRIAGEVTPAHHAWVAELLDTVGLAGLGGRLPGTLSGGQAARVGLARALARKPGLWLLDEPTGNLDPATALEVFEFLLRLHQDLRPTTLLVTHNMALAERCGRTLRLGPEEPRQG